MTTFTDFNLANTGFGDPDNFREQVTEKEEIRLACFNEPASTSDGWIERDLIFYGPKEKLMNKNVVTTAVAHFIHQNNLSDFSIDQESVKKPIPLTAPEVPWAEAQGLDTNGLYKVRVTIRKPNL